MQGFKMRGETGSQRAAKWTGGARTRDSHEAGTTPGAPY
jgi:hypothetical protein